MRQQRENVYNFRLCSMDITYYYKIYDTSTVKYNSDLRNVFFWVITE